MHSSIHYETARRDDLGLTISECVCGPSQIYFFSWFSSGSICSSFPPGSLCENKHGYVLYSFLIWRWKINIGWCDAMVTWLWLVSLQILLHMWKKTTIHPFSCTHIRASLASSSLWASWTLHCKHVITQCNNSTGKVRHCEAVRRSTQPSPFVLCLLGLRLNQGNQVIPADTKVNLASIHHPSSPTA